jgi:F0F1-type ATP synthase membrane subunit c/vacuolar-type H+-ATPase subunit K
MAMGTSTSLQILSPEAKPGHIVTRINGGFDLAKEPYDVELFGVIVESSTLSLFDTTEPQARLVMQTGTAQILVSSANGTIAKGDYITSSSNPGVGQKADKTGFVIGKALEDFSPASPNDAGPVWATLEPKTAYINNTVQTNLLEAIKSGALSPLLNPVESLRYILAALIVASTFIIGFSTFGKSSGRSIEAMGRNPLAQQSIRTAMIFNMILSFGVMLIGLALAYLILVL